jgi:hypothetical protein
MGGNYLLTWKTLGRCTYYADLNGNDIFSASTATSGVNHIHNLATQNYWIHMVTGPAPDCAWSATFTSEN